MNRIKVTQDNLRDDYQVVKGNILNEATLDNKTTLVEYRILLIALSKISPVTKTLKVSFKTDDFCKLLNLVRNGMYSYIREASKKLASRTLTVEDKNKKHGETYSWLTKITYNEAYISLIFNPLLEEYILDIKKEGGYTKYFIKNILKLKSIYSVRLYELLKQYVKLGKRTISVEDLKQKIGATEKSHTKMNFFRNRILIPIKNEINICTDLSFDFDEVKEGRKVKSIIFYINSKTDISEDSNNLRKDKLILVLQNKIHDLTGHIFEARHMNILHRNILLDLLRMFESGAFNKVFIRSPEKFFIYQLNEIQKNYDLDLLNKKFKDY